MQQRRSRVPDLALLGAAVVWGCTFVTVKNAVADVPPLEFVGLRFTIGALVLAIVWPRVALDAVRTNRRNGLLIGVALGVGAATQTAGIARTTPSKAGFITGLYVVTTPIFDAILIRRLPRMWALIGVALSTVGLALLSLKFTHGELTANAGDMLVLACAFAFGIQIVLLSRLVTLETARVATIQQLAVTGVGCLVLSAAFEHMRMPTGQAWFGIIFTGVVATALAVAIQVWSQQFISPTRAAIIAAMEAPFAALVSFIVVDERLSVRAWIGAVMIFAGMMVMEIRPRETTEEDADIHL